MSLAKSKKSKVQAESEVCEAIIRFEKEYMGCGPVETLANICSRT